MIKEKKLEILDQKWQWALNNLCMYCIKVSKFCQQPGIWEKKLKVKLKPKESAEIHKKRPPIHSLHNLLVDARSGGDNRVEEPLFRQLVASQKK